MFAYVGSYTTPERKGHGNGINVYKVDSRSGAFRHVQHLGGLENPSFLAINKAGTRLYSVHGDRSEATSYVIDKKTGHLKVLNRQSTGGYNVIHLDFDAAERFLFVTNYGTDSIAVLPIAKDGSLGPYSTLATVTGTPGPHRREQNNIRPHHNPLDREGKHFFLPCKGGDVVISYRLDAKRGIAIEVGRVTSRPGAGPRHIDFHPKKPFAYVINELDSTITTYRKAGPVLTALQTVPSCPESFTGYSTGAEIWVGHDGCHVYVTNRGHDSIGVFAIDPSKGTLSPKQWVPTYGSVPRFFAFDRAERFLYVANQGSDTIFAYRVGSNGKLLPTRLKVEVGSPACIVFSRGAST